MDTERAGPPAPSWNECVDLLMRLPEMPLDARISAVEVLMRNPSPGIRQQALRVGAAVLPEARLTDFLRDETDAVRRNAGAEIFQLRGTKSLPLVISLLADPEPDVVLQAVLILARMRDPRALEPLHGILDHADANVVQEALLAIGQLGDSRSVPHLVPFLDADAWLQLAAIQALGDLRAREAVPALAAKLADPLVGLPTAEALARIGGDAVLAALAGCWLASRDEAEAEELVELLAHVAEGLDLPPQPLAEELSSALGERLADSSEAIRRAAARCLLALGANPWDVEALQVLLAEPGAAADLPPALCRRSDLVPALLVLPGKARVWGLRLAAQLPAGRAAAVLARQLADVPERPEVLAALVEALVQTHAKGLAAPLLDFYLRLAPESRAALLPALESRAGEMLVELARHPEIDPAEAIVLAASLGVPAVALRPRLLALPSAPRRAALERLLGREDVVRALPWDEWLAEDSSLTALAAQAAARYRLTGLLPALLRRAGETPALPVLLALGELREAAAVPLLLRLLDEHPPLRSALLESLGKIGAPAAREALRKTIALGGPETEIRVAYRALAECAELRDEPLFRAAAAHPDWYIRLVAAELLATAAAQPENLASLTLLAADPVSAVADRALRALES